MLKELVEPRDVIFRPAPLSLWNSRIFQLANVISSEGKAAKTLLYFYLSICILF